MSVFWKIWCVLLSCYLRLEIRPFALLPTLQGFLDFQKNHRRWGSRFSRKKWERVIHIGGLFIEGGGRVVSPAFHQ